MRDPDPGLDASGDGALEHPCDGKVVINELQPAGDGGAEFVELFNTTDCAVSLTDWKLLYRSANNAAGVGALHAFATGDSVRARAFLLVANAKFAQGTPSVYDLKGSMSNEGGQIGLVNDEAMLVDAVGYGMVRAGADGGVAPDSGASPGVGTYTEKTPAPAPPLGSSLSRKKDGLDTDNNKADFVVTAKHTAGVSNE